MADRIICTNLSTYDYNKYDAIGIVSSLSVHAISAFRESWADLTGLVGGRNSAIEKKYVDVRKHALKDLREKAHDLNAVMLVGIDFDISSTDQKFLVCMATGTVLVAKKQRGGSNMASCGVTNNKSRKSECTGNRNSATKSINKRRGSNSSN